MAAYYPLGDAELKNWLDNFVAALADVIAALSLPLTFGDALGTANTAYGTALTTNVASQAQAVSDRTAKDAARDTVLAELALVVNQLRPNPLFTGDFVASLGLPEYDTTRTPIVPGAEVPTLVIDTAAPQHHTIKFLMVTAGGGLGKAKPEWARACRIMYAIVASGSPPPAIEAMTFLASDTNSPYEWDIPGTEVGKDIWYRGAFETPKGEIGTWSDPAKGTVTG